MTAKALSPSPVEAVPPLSPEWGWRVLLGGLAACAVAGVVGFAIDWSAVTNQPPEMAERLKWASGQGGVNSTRSEGEMRRLQAEIGKTTPLSTVRVGLVAVGVLAAASGVWMRGGHRLAWLAFAGAALLGAGGLPMHWDSLKIPLTVGGTLAAVGGGLGFLPLKWRLSALAVAVLVHFGGTLTAVTWPDTQGRTAWVSNQSALRVYLPYFRLTYQSNAYHFYSPDPGPASKFFILLEYELYEPTPDPKTGEYTPVLDPKTGKTQTTAEWVDLPKRRNDYKDPLGLTYYRRLSLTELASYSTPGTMLPATWERADIVQRRVANQNDKTGKQVVVPNATIDQFQVDLNQYRQPQSATRRAVYPTYARHLAVEYTRNRTTADGRELRHQVTGLKMFRVEHRIIEAPQFLEHEDAEMARIRERNPATFDKSRPTRTIGLSPYHPAVYAPYYLGDYTPDGTLKDPNDPLLYWYTPVQYTPNVGKGELTFVDWMSRYAGREFPWEGKE